MSVRLRKLLWLLVPKISREITLETWNGRLTFNRRDRVVGKMLYARREFEKSSMLQVIELLDCLGMRKRGVVVDIGANIGMIAIGFVVNGLFKRALAFEPDPYNFSLLLANIRQNGLDDRFTCFKFALSAEDGTADLELSASNYGDHRLRRAAGLPAGFYKEENRRTITVPVRRFDSIAATEKLPLEEAGLVWVDIQGHEGHFLRGAQSLLRHEVPIVTEFWPYAIERSGMSVEEYTSVVSSNFSRYVHLLKDRHESRPISAFSELFDIYRKPREMGTIMLLK
jgi:FkbM family methyltransferase